jgi:hypothetical protein
METKPAPNVVAINHAEGEGLAQFHSISANLTTGASDSSLASWWSRTESLLDRLGDRLNPILVKEARQAMKSRQFIVTFSLLLICGWLWTVLFVISGLPAIYYVPAGPGVLMGYYGVLSVPLLIVVPYAAFRSLAGEWEDGTFELLSITTLSARQIVAGKLASAVLQMMVYYSALAPCIAFTYLLRGIDIVTVAVLLGYSFLASLLLSAFGLMMATITRVRHWQVLLSVVLVMALLVFTFVWDMAFLAFLGEGDSLPLDHVDFWIAHVCGLSFYFPAVLLLLLIAAGQITFASENRSTPIRWLLLVPHALIAGWFIYLWYRLGFEAPLYVLILVGGAYWMLVGAVLTGETAELSPRARRQLPQSFLGRMLFTWFNPGSATGYVFAVMNLAALILVAFIVPASGPLPSTNIVVGPAFRTMPDLGAWICVSGCVLGYVAGYLGLTRLLAVAARQFVYVGMPAVFLGHLIVVGGGVLVPLLIQRMMIGWNYANSNYSLLQLPNWAWTLMEVGRNGATPSSVLLVVVVAGVGGIIFVLNFLLAAHEVQHTRQAAPRRVVEDEQILHPIPASRRKRNPWDDSSGDEPRSIAAD